jgi:hypothetical protein
MERSPARLVGVPLVVACIAAAGCGKKGPPLPPLVRTPEAVSRVDARRLGSDVYITLTVPSRNADGAAPADVRRIEVLALTADVRPRGDAFLTSASRIATIAVAPASPDERQEPAPGGADVASQGGVVTVRETLAPGDLSPAREPVAQQPGKAAAIPAVPEPAPASPKAGDASTGSGPQRFYMAYAFSSRDRPSAAGAVAAVPLAPAPDPPGEVAVTYTPEVLTVSWSGSGGATSYNVYRADAPPPGEAGAPSGAAPPAPVNAEPVRALAFPDEVLFGAGRCYTVRAVTAAGAALVEGEASVPACVTPVDTFAPAPPADVAAVARDDGTIELRWTANTEADLAGYLVLRGTAGDATLLPITDTPIAEARYIDRDVRPGVRYVYAVVAVDSRMPPNRSPESSRDEAAAR